MLASVMEERRDRPGSGKPAGHPRRCWKGAPPHVRHRSARLAALHRQRGAALHHLGGRRRLPAALGGHDERGLRGPVRDPGRLRRPRLPGRAAGPPPGPEDGVLHGRGVRRHARRRRGDPALRARVPPRGRRPDDGAVGRGAEPDGVSSRASRRSPSPSASARPRPTCAPAEPVSLPGSSRGGGSSARDGLAELRARLVAALPVVVRAAERLARRLAARRAERGARAHDCVCITRAKRSSTRKRASASSAPAATYHGHGPMTSSSEPSDGLRRRNM